MMHTCCSLACAALVTASTVIGQVRSLPLRFDADGSRVRATVFAKADGLRAWVRYGGTPSWCELHLPVERWLALAGREDDPAFLAAYRPPDAEPRLARVEVLLDGATPRLHRSAEVGLGSIEPSTIAFDTHGGHLFVHDVADGSLKVGSLGAQLPSRWHTIVTVREIPMLGVPRLVVTGRSGESGVLLSETMADPARWRVRQLENGSWAIEPLAAPPTRGIDLVGGLRCTGVIRVRSSEAGTVLLVDDEHGTERELGPVVSGITAIELREPLVPGALYHLRLDELRSATHQAIDRHGRAIGTVSRLTLTSRAAYVGSPSAGCTLRIAPAEADVVDVVVWAWIGDGPPATSTVGATSFLAPTTACHRQVDVTGGEPGDVAVTLPLPDDPTLVGKRLYFQAGVLGHRTELAGVTDIAGVAIAAAPDAEVVRLDSALGAAAPRSTAAWLNERDPRWVDWTTDFAARLADRLGGRDGR